MRRPHHHHDDGFSLIEVIVAIVIIGIVASSALWFFINGMQTSSNLQRQQAAVSIATSAMENSFVNDPRLSITEGVSGLVIGRPSADVDSAFTALSTLGIEGVAHTYPLSDPAGGTPVVPISENVVRNGIPYTVYTLVGSCYRTASSSGSEQECGKAVGYSNEPATAPVGTARLLRIIVAVTWDSIGDECDGLCTYQVATLVDPSLDLEWNRVIEPVAVDDTYSFAVVDTGTTTLDLLDNDVLGSVPSYPVSIVSGLPLGAGTLGTPASNGTVSYTPPAAIKGTWKSGIFDFTYRVRDSRGQTDDATGSIYLQPASADDPEWPEDRFETYLGISQVLDVSANDLGSPVSITIVSPPVRGSISVSGTTVTYTATSLGYDQFVYTYSDASDLISPPATALINVEAVSATDVLVMVPYRTDSNTSAGWLNISSELRGSYTSAEIVLSDQPTPSATSPAGGQWRVVGSDVEFQPPANAAGEWTFPFALKLGGFETAPAIATMRVVAPVPTLLAVDDPVPDLQADRRHNIDIGGNDIPSAWWNDSDIEVSLGDVSTGCGIWNSWQGYLGDGVARLNLKNLNQDVTGCTAEYTLTRKSDGASSTAAVTYNIYKD